MRDTRARYIGVSRVNARAGAARSVAPEAQRGGAVKSRSRESAPTAATRSGRYDRARSEMTRCAITKCAPGRLARDAGTPESKHHRRKNRPSRHIASARRIRSFSGARICACRAASCDLVLLSCPARRDVPPTSRASTIHHAPRALFDARAPSSTTAGRCRSGGAGHIFVRPARGPGSRRPGRRHRAPRAAAPRPQVGPRARGEALLAARRHDDEAPSTSTPTGFRLGGILFSRRGASRGSMALLKELARSALRRARRHRRAARLDDLAAGGLARRVSTDDAGVERPARHLRVQQHHGPRPSRQRRNSVSSSRLCPPVSRS